MPIQEPESGKPALASWGKDVAQALNKEARDGPLNRGRYRGEGPYVPMGLWELTHIISCVSSSGTDGPHTPSAWAVRVRLNTTSKRYIVGDVSEIARIYMPSVVPAEEPPYCFYTDLSIGDRVWCYDNEESGRWEIAGRPLGPAATHILCDVDGAVVAADATITVDNVRIMQPIGATVYPATGAVAPTVIQNTHDWDIDNNALLQAIWNQNNDRWEAYQVDCPA